MSAAAPCAGCGAPVCDCRCENCAAGAASLGPHENRMGLSRIDTRLGGHAGFFAAATQALSSAETPALRDLATRDLDDPIIALIDGWAMIADILTFYRDRFANEAYLRTAREERSLRGLAAQVGYRPRPGVSASVALAWLLDPTAKPVTIPAGARAQSVPKPGEQMQSFETMQPLEARAEWSEMTPRRDWLPPLDRIDALLRAEIRLSGAQLVVRPGERLLFVFGMKAGWQIVREVAAAKTDIASDCLIVTLKPRPGLTARLAEELLDLLDKAASAAGDHAASVVRGITSYFLGASPRDARRVVDDTEQDVYRVFDEIERAPVAATKGARGYSLDAILADVTLAAGKAASGAPRRIIDALRPAGPARAALIAGAAPEVGAALYAAWEKLPANDATPDKAPQLYLLRFIAGAFGSNAPALLPDNSITDDADIVSPDGDYVFLDTLADGVEGGGFALMDAPATSLSSTRLLRIGRVRDVQQTARSDYGLSARVTRLDVVGLEDDEPLGLPPAVDGRGMMVRLLRQILYVAQSEKVTRAPEPLDDPVQGDAIMLDGLYPEFETGRAIIVSGERCDIVAGSVPVQGVSGGERARVAAVTQSPLAGSPGDTPHTVLHLTAPLTFRYGRAATLIYGNVVTATHGETVSETLGSGDAGRAFQRFPLRRAPLTFVAASTTSGVVDALRIEANGVALAEVETLADAGPEDRVFQLALAANGAGAIEGGDGKTGMRFPGGAENIRATYRVGIGAVGNVDAEQISLATTRPLGVRGVVNPLRASGGADRDGVETIRSNTPVPTRALSPQSRLVSVADFEYFARAFAGIGDVRAAMLSDGRHRAVFITLAGVEDAPLDPDEGLIGALSDAYSRYGDPALPVVVAPRERVTLLIQAGVSIAPDASRTRVDAALRARLAGGFSFPNRGLARPAYRSELIALMQATPGVDYVDVDVFGGVSDATLQDAASLAETVRELRRQAKEGRPPAFVAALPARSAPPSSGQKTLPAERLLPAQAAYLRADVPETLVINWL